MLHDPFFPVYCGDLPFAGRLKIGETHTLSAIGSGNQIAISVTFAADGKKSGGAIICNGDTIFRCIFQFRIQHFTNSGQDLFCKMDCRFFGKNEQQDHDPANQPQCADPDGKIPEKQEIFHKKTRQQKTACQQKCCRRKIQEKFSIFFLKITPVLIPVCQQKCHSRLRADSHCSGAYIHVVLFAAFHPVLHSS